VGGSANKLALLFPGQGVGDPETRLAVEELRPDLLDLAGELCGDDPFERLAEGTRFAQPAVYCASLAGFERLGRPQADFFAGHSLGEFAALAAAGTISDLAGLRVVAERGRLMQAAAAKPPPGGMLAVGADRSGAARLADRFGLTVANENSPAQLVLSGPESGIEAAEAAAKADGVRAKRLAIAGAFHSPAMRPAVAPFLASLEEVELRPPSAPVMSGLVARPFSADIRELLSAALTGPVRWLEVMRALGERGVGRVIDVGPGKVLAGLAKRCLEGVEAQTAAGSGLEAAHA
jgi:[acyl-carrier-protein] S-malonyltransferase